MRRKQTFESTEGVERVDAMFMTAGEGERLQDLPMRILFHRLWENTPRHRPPAVYSTALKGYTTEFDCYGFGVKVFVRITLDGMLSLFTEDADGVTKICDWECAPLRRNLETGEAE